ncbi:hypothetical protein BSKO_13760 [Bryopsis sp. KO-2023]|nr:hypothetical protein BSKO_13760 [Bryopsis sp. KO-2023]
MMQRGMQLGKTGQIGVHKRFAVNAVRPSQVARPGSNIFRGRRLGFEAQPRLVPLDSRRTSLCVVGSANPSVNVVTADSRPTVLITEKLGQAGLDILSQVANVDCSYGMEPAELKAKVSLCDAVIIRSATQITREVFEASKGRLKVVGRAGVGVDNIDLAAATENGCLVVNAPTANTVAAAEHGIALLCALSRNVAQADQSMKQGKWERGKYVGAGLTGKTLAIMGFGKVGSEVGRRAKGLGMNVIAHDPYASEEKARAIGIKLVGFEEALSTADFFSLHMPLTPKTNKMFNAETFAKMKKGARIVNVARGGVIDDDALLEALNDGTIGQVALDVFEVEPPPQDSALVAHPNVVCTPHLGASTVEAQEGVALEIVDAVVSALKGDLVSTAVNAPVVPPEVLAELEPFVTLAQGLGKAVVSLVDDTGFDELSICYSSPRGDDLDTRLLRAMVIKGVLEGNTTANVNLVNADLLAEQRGIKIQEVTVRSEGRDVLSNLSVSMNSKSTTFSAALDSDGRIYVEGCVKAGIPCLTQIGQFDAEVGLEGTICLVRQVDQPGIIAAIASEFAKGDLNVSFMTVTRTGKGQEAIMAIGVDEEPSAENVAAIKVIPGVEEFTMFKEF